jgi:DNA-binding MarR family transcriptional regulator
MPPFNVGQLDEVIHGRLRLGIMAYLAQNTEVAEFNELKEILDATQGNLSIHLRKLEDAGYISIEKSFLGRKPLTRVRLTTKGRKAFVSYLDAISKLVAEPNGNSASAHDSRTKKLNPKKPSPRTSAGS